MIKKALDGIFSKPAIRSRIQSITEERARFIFEKGVRDLLNLTNCCGLNFYDVWDSLKNINVMASNIKTFRLRTWTSNESFVAQYTGP